MRHKGLILSIIVFLTGFFGYGQDYTTIDNSLEEYFKALENESIAVKVQEADFMLGSCDPGDVRNHVALKIYDHYLNSALMGDESVAVHLADEWFAPGKASMTNDIDLMNAKIYAEFNRRSLIGCPAPSLRLKTPEGEVREALGIQSDSLAAGSSRLRVLFLYDTDCSKCQMETILLRSMFRQVEYPIDFIAVYTGDNAEKWALYREKELNFEMKKARIFHYWDPGMDSDFQRKYGVLQTPRMLLIGKDGSIIGRNLDTQALMSLLEVYAVEPDLDYGGEESIKMFSAIFPEEDLGLTADSVKTVMKYIESKTLPVKDTLNFKQLTGDLLYYLVGRRGEAFSYGADYVAREMILAKPEVWSAENDRYKIIGLAEMVTDMMDLAADGSKMPSLKVPGTMVSASGEKEGTWRLDRLRPGTYVFFHIHGCPICATEMEAARSMVKSHGGRVLAIETDSMWSTDPDLAEALLDSFDLSSLPFILKTGRGHKVVRKYITLVGK